MFLSFFFFFKTTTDTYHFLRKQNLVWAQKPVWNKCSEACDGSPSPRQTPAAGCYQITKFHFKSSAHFLGGAGWWGKQRWQNPAATADFERRSRRISLEVQWLRCFPGGSVGKESTCNVGDPGLIPGLGRLSEGGHGNPLQYSCPKNPHCQRSLAGYSLWSSKDLDITEWLRLHLSIQEGAGLIPGWGVKIPHALWPKKSKHKTETGLLQIQ